MGNEISEATLKEWNGAIEKLVAEKKAMGDEMIEQKKRLEQLEAKFNRPQLIGGTTDLSKERKAFREFLRKGENAPAEVKASLTQGSDTSGYLAPVEISTEMIKAVTLINPIRSIASVQKTAAASVKFPKRTGQMSAAWTGETTTRTERTGLTVGSETIPVHEMYAFVDVPRVTIEDAAFDIEAFLMAEFAEQFAVAEGAAFLNGTGVGKPEGIMTNASVGDSHNGHATTLYADGVLDLTYARAEPYARNASFLMKRATVGAVRKLKDTAGYYLWNRDALAAGQPSLLSGYPVIECPDMPAVGSATYPMAFGDFKRGYKIVDRVEMEVIVDPLTQAASGCVRYAARRRVGGQVVDANAIVKLHMAV